MENETYVRYRINGAEENHVSMQRIFAAGEYVWALFIGHLIIEKLLKACCARSLGKEVPRIHNLLRLAQIAHIDLTPEQREQFGRLNSFHIRTRYADWKNELRQIATRAYTEKQSRVIEGLREWLLQLLSEKSNP